MALHPVSLRIDEAIALLERCGEDVTPTAIKINVMQRLTWADYSPEQSNSEGLDRRIQQRLRDRGYQITDTEARTRRDFWHCTLAELDEQLRVKQDSSDYDRARLRADEAVVTYLREKEKELGYEVCPDLFAEDIARIYAMHGVTPPGAGAR
jgi:hypothetical protein